MAKMMTARNALWVLFVIATLVFIQSLVVALG